MAYTKLIDLIIVRPELSSFKGCAFAYSILISWLQTHASSFIVNEFCQQMVDIVVYDGTDSIESESTEIWKHPVTVTQFTSGGLRKLKQS